MKILALLLLITVSLVGCSTTVPVKTKFPEAPQHLMNKCPQLQKLNDEPKLSEVAKTVSANYTTYHECALKNETWIEWYNNQKNIFESVK
jgi:hypothetical protein